MTASSSEPLALAFAETFYYNDATPVLDIQDDASFPPLFSPCTSSTGAKLYNSSARESSNGPSTFVQVATHRVDSRRLHAPMKQTQFRSGLESQKIYTGSQQKQHTATSDSDIKTEESNLADPSDYYYVRKEENMSRALKAKKHRQQLSDRLLRRYVRLASKDYNDQDHDASDDFPVTIKLKQEARLNELLQTLPKHYFAPGKDMSRIAFVKYLMCNVE